MNAPAPISALDKLWHWHFTSDPARRPPQYLVERVFTDREAERAAEGEAGIAEGELHELHRTMARFANRREYEDKLAARLDAIGRHTKTPPNCAAAAGTVG